MNKRFIFILFCFSLTAFAKGQSEQQEADLKAVFIYNFTKYIEWNRGSVPGDFIIGVTGPSPVISSLTEIARTKMVGKKRIVVKQFSKPEDITYTDILFIPSNDPYPLSSILERVGRGTLTISEKEGYAQQGTAFNFVLINNKLKFESNLKAIDYAGLKASSQLLKLAIIVN